jgi:AraC-like DNA-binding protein
MTAAGSRFRPSNGTPHARTMSPLTLTNLTTGAVTLGATALTAALGFRLRTNSARLLGAFFACLSLEYLCGTLLLGWREWLSIEMVRWIRVIEVPGAYLLGPLLHAYTKALKSPSPSPALHDVRHAVPALAAFVFSFGNATFNWDASPLGQQLFLVSMHAWVPQGIPYLILAAWGVTRARKTLEQVVADESALHLAWLRWLIALIGMCWMLSAADRFLGVGDFVAWQWFDAAFGGLTMIALYLLAWFGLHQRILVATGLVESTATAGEAPGPRYERSGLDATQCAHVAADLNRIMTSERLYTDSGFDLLALSQRSGWSMNYISQALNQGLNRNFFEFVNAYRVADAERCLKDPDDRRSILEIALACGFGSKSTFNAVFKRISGMTPGECRRRPASSVRVAAT